MNARDSQVIALNKSGLENYLICKKLNLTPGQVAGILWRNRNPRPVKKINKKPEKFYFHRWSIDLDNDMHNKIKKYMNELNIPKTEAVRLLITFGLESLEGE